MTLSLNTQIFLGVLAGIGLGFLFIHWRADTSLTKNGLYLCGLLATLFIDLLKMMLVPLVFNCCVGDDFCFFCVIDGAGDADLALRTCLHQARD